MQKSKIIEKSNNAKIENAKTQKFSKNIENAKTQKFSKNIEKYKNRKIE
jgi:hypothetical protein